MNSTDDSAASKRKLLYFPILHTQVDMASLGDSFQHAVVRGFGRRGWSRNVRLVDELWMKIEGAIDALTLPCERVRLYQDGLADCGREKEIVAELAKTGSRNYRILLRLIEQGAIIMGTESPELLAKEYQLMKQLVSRAGLPQQRKDTQEKLRRALVQQRDAFIARRINSTLRAGEIGVLFLGMLHSLETHLNSDIQVTYPIGAAPAPRRKVP